jgi:hypothetical protein
LYNHVYVFIYSLANRKHFYISPLKDSPFKAPPSPSQMTPRSRQLYSFGEGVGVSYFKIISEDQLSTNIPQGELVI